MEASEDRLFDEAEGSVRPIGDRLVIENLTVEDERAARLVRERAEAGQPPPRTVADAIEIGARVLDREDTAAEVDYVRAEVERTIGSAGERVTKALDAGRETLAEQLAIAFGADRSGSVQQQIKEILGKANEEQRAAIARLFSTEDGANPLTDFKNAVVRAIKESRGETMAVREKLAELTEEFVRLQEKGDADQRVAEEAERGTAKGRSFEERVHDALEEIAAGRGDVAHHVGDESGAAGGKKGDSLIEIGAAESKAAGRIVFEAKDKQLSKPKAWQELDEAMEQRDAGFAVLVVAGEEKIPAGREELNEYEGNKLIVAVDVDQAGGRPLELAYRYARCRALLLREGELTLDAAGVRDATAEARSALDQARNIKLSLTKAEKGIFEARDGVEGMVGDVMDRLTRIETLISDAS